MRFDIIYMVKIDNWEEETEARVAQAVSYFKQGYNCSQSVAMTFADMYGVPVALMARLSATFGGGIGRMRETCGAACGMFLLAGLEVTNHEDKPNEGTIDNSTFNPYPDAELKKANYEVAQRLAGYFKEVTGSLLCKELLGLAKKDADGKPADIKIVATPEARTAEYYKKRPCAFMVETGVRSYMRYLKEKEAPQPPKGAAVQI